MARRGADAARRGLDRSSPAGEWRACCGNLVVYVALSIVSQRNLLPPSADATAPPGRREARLISPDAERKRQLLGLLTLACVGSGLAILGLHHWEDASGASLLRTGILLGALWMALPSRRWAAAWAHLSTWNLLGLVGLCLLAGRFKHIFLGGIALMAFASIFLRPRRRRKSDAVESRK